MCTIQFDFFFRIVCDGSNETKVYFSTAAPRMKMTKNNTNDNGNYKTDFIAIILMCVQVYGYTIYVIYLYHTLFLFFFPCANMTFTSVGIVIQPNQILSDNLYVIYDSENDRNRNVLYFVGCQS